MCRDTSIRCINMFRLNCVKLRIGLENFNGVFARVLFAIMVMSSDRLFFASVEVDKNYSSTLARWARDQPQPVSFSQLQGRKGERAWKRSCCLRVTFRQPERKSSSEFSEKCLSVVDIIGLIRLNWYLSLRSDGVGCKTCVEFPNSHLSVLDPSIAGQIEPVGLAEARLAGFANDVNKSVVRSPLLLTSVEKRLFLVYLPALRVSRWQIQVVSDSFCPTTFSILDKQKTDAKENREKKVVDCASSPNVVPQPVTKCCLVTYLLKIMGSGDSSAQCEGGTCSPGDLNCICLMF